MDILMQSSRQHSDAIKGKRDAKMRKFHRKVPGSPSHRRSLVQLQPCADDQSKLVGKDGVIRLANPRPRTPKRKRDGDDDAMCRKMKTPRRKHFEVFDENIPEITQQKKQKTTEQEAYELMVQEEVPEKYWEALAEERRVALEETLKENEELHQQVQELEEENERLKVTADQAVYLADVVQELLGEKKDDNEEEKETEDDEDGTNEDETPEDKPETEGSVEENKTDTSKPLEER